MAQTLRRRVLGLDPGLATVGYAVVEADARERYRLCAAGVITTPATEEIPQRLTHLYEQTRALIEEFAPQVLAIEKLFFKKNVTTGIQVAQARGVLLLAGAQLPVHEYAPAEVKRRITGSGKALKVQMQAMVQRLLALSRPPRPDDAADAVAVALCCLLEARTPLARALRQGGR